MGLLQLGLVQFQAGSGEFVYLCHALLLGVLGSWGSWGPPRALLLGVLYCMHFESRLGRLLLLLLLLGSPSSATLICDRLTYLVVVFRERFIPRKYVQEVLPALGAASVTAQRHWQEASQA
jgi:hypothetical protein